MNLEDLAKPGDEDLDIDIDGVTIMAVVVDGREILMSARGGFGAWISDDGTLAEFPLGDEVAKVTDMDFRMRFDSMKDEGFDYLVDRLQEWRDRSVPLRLCGAPGRLFSLIEHTSKWLPLPRNPHPSWR